MIERLFEKVDMRTTNDQFMLIRVFSLILRSEFFTACVDDIYLESTSKKFYLIVYMH